MGHIYGMRDADLHLEDGVEHRGTARTANGRDLEQHERRIRAHMAAHKLDEQDLADELSAVGAQVHLDGTVTVYHHTTPVGAAAIRDTGQMTGKEDGVFFTTKGTADAHAGGRGDATVALRLPLRLLQLDDALSDEAHVKIPLRRAGESVDVTQYLVAQADVDEQAARVAAYDERPDVAARVEEWGIEAYTTLLGNGNEGCSEDYPDGQHTWRVTLKSHNGTLTVAEYTMGAVHRDTPPTAAEVLSDLASEASGVAGGVTFEQWAEDRDANPDSRKAEQTFNMIKEDTEGLRVLLGDERFQILLYETESM